MSRTDNIPVVSHTIIYDPRDRNNFMTTFFTEIFLDFPRAMPEFFREQTITILNAIKINKTIPLKQTNNIMEKRDMFVSCDLDRNGRHIWLFLLWCKKWKTAKLIVLNHPKTIIVEVVNLFSGCFLRVSLTIIKWLMVTMN